MWAQLTYDPLPALLTRDTTFTDRVDDASTEIRVDIHPAPVTLEEEQLDCLADLRLRCPVGLFRVTVFAYDDDNGESGECRWLQPY